MSVGEQWRRAIRSAPPEHGGGRVAYHALRIAILVLVAGITYLFFPTSPAVDSPIFEVGSVADETVIAPFAFTVRKTDADLARERDELAASVKPILVFSRPALDSATGALARFAEALNGAAEGGGAAAAAAIQRAGTAQGVALSPAEAEYLVFAGRRRALLDGVRRAYMRWLTDGVTASGVSDNLRGEVIVRNGTEERGRLADSLLTFGGLLSRARATHPDPNSSLGDALYIKVLGAFFHPTILPDRIATERRRQELRASVDPNRYQVRAGEKIVGDHEVVGKTEFEKMRALHDEMSRRVRGERAWGRVLGAITYNALVLAIFGIAIALFRPQMYRSMRALLLFGVVSLLVIAGAALAAHATPIRPELVPVALAAIMLSILFDPRISMIAAMILAVLVGGQGAYRGTNALFINLIGGAAAALSVRVIRRRDQSYYSILTTALAYLLAAVALGLTLGWQPSEIARTAGWGALNASISVMLAMFLLPLAERFTGITTDFRLLEYSDLNRPLLRRLSMEAPGTYYHTLRMADLTEAACNAIGANGLLARVGTYYHDIGKLKKPQFFVENQARGRNPHDKLKPGTSASIIRNHVREGLDLAEESRLPNAIKAFIAEHHGTGPISYFLEKAKERDGVTPANSGEFAYPGPVPQTAETAVSMLADGIEAATRVLHDATPEKIRDLIDHIVRQRMEQGQLRDAPLTLKQLDIVKEEFARVLLAMSHQRIDYPVSAGGITAEFVARDA